LDKFKFRQPQWITVMCFNVGQLLLMGRNGHSIGHACGDLVSGINDLVCPICIK